jgi:hypothetical protein
MNFDVQFKERSWGQPPRPRPQTEARDLKLAGLLSIAADGSFTLQIAGKSGAITRPPLPGVTVIYPSGGDDTQAFIDAWNSLPTDNTLQVSGMLQISNSMLLSGANKRVVADPATRSGFHSTNSNPMSGGMCSMAHVRDASHCEFLGLEFDCASTPNCAFYLENGSDNIVEGCYIHDIGWRTSDPRALGAIFSDNQTRLILRGNRIERTGGVLETDGCRGIWIRGQVDALVEGNEISDTGHTCCAVECSTATIRNNRALRSMVNGSLYKLVYRCSQPAGTVLFQNNYAEGAYNSGMMLEDGSFALLDMDGNTWKNCGRENSSFGAMYSNGKPATNIKFRNSIVDGCRSTGALRYGNYCLFENNTITNGPAILHLEESDTNIKLQNSGDVSIGSNCHTIWVDGQQRA